MYMRYRGGGIGHSDPRTCDNSGVSRVPMMAAEPGEDEEVLEDDAGNEAMAADPGGEQAGSGSLGAVVVGIGSGLADESADDSASAGESDLGEAGSGSLSESNLEDSESDAAESEDSSSDSDSEIEGDDAD